MKSLCPFKLACRGRHSERRTAHTLCTPMPADLAVSARKREVGGIARADKANQLPPSIGQVIDATSTHTQTGAVDSLALDLRLERRSRHAQFPGGSEGLESRPRLSSSVASIISLSCSRGPPQEERTVWMLAEASFVNPIGDEPGHSKSELSPHLGRFPHPRRHFRQIGQLTMAAIVSLPALPHIPLKIQRNCVDRKRQPACLF